MVSLRPSILGCKSYLQLQVSDFQDEAGKPISASFRTHIPDAASLRANGQANLQSTDVTEAEKAELSETMFHESILQLVDSSFQAADQDGDDRLDCESRDCIISYFYLRYY
jgi:hypothetical protein